MKKSRCLKVLLTVLYVNMSKIVGTIMAP